MIGIDLFGSWLNWVEGFSRRLVISTDGSRCWLGSLAGQVALLILEEGVQKQQEVDHDRNVKHQVVTQRVIVHDEAQQVCRLNA